MAMRAGVCGVVLVRVRADLLAVVSVLRAGMHLGLGGQVRGRRQAESMLAERHGERSIALQREPQDHERG